MKDLKKWYNSLPDGAKLAVIIIAVILALRVLSYVRGFVTMSNQTALQNGIVQSLEQQGEEPSFSSLDYQQMANRLDTAMRGPGTDYDEVFAVMGMLNNNLDAVKLNQAFGVREYTAFFITFRSSLLEWLNDDLDSEQMTRLWNLLETKGITYRFT